MRANAVTKGRWERAVLAVVLVLVLAPTLAWGQAPVPAGPGPAPALRAFDPALPDGVRPESLLVGVGSGWALPMAAAGTARFEAVLGSGFSAADLGQIELRFFWSEQWDETRPRAKGDTCEYTLKRDDVAFSTWKAPCGERPVSLKPGKLPEGTGEVALVVRVLGFRAPKATYQGQLPPVRASLRMVYATSGALSEGARPSELFSPHPVVAALREGRSALSWKHGKIVKAPAKRQCDEPCEAECSCRAWIEDGGRAEWVDEGEVFTAGDLQAASATGEWVFASKFLSSAEPGDCWLYDHGGFVIGRDGALVKVGPWPQGCCGSEADACKPLCPLTVDDLALGPVLAREVTFLGAGSGPEGTTLVIVDAVTNCRRAGKTIRRATTYSLRNEAGRWVLTPSR